MARALANVPRDGVFLVILVLTFNRELGSLAEWAGERRLRLLWEFRALAAEVERLG